MTLYIDEDAASELLARLLRQAGHDVVMPGDASMLGRMDPEQFAHAISQGRVLLTKNQRDFELLHSLVLVAGGHHPGLLIVCQENNPRRDLSERGIINAIGKLEAAAYEVRDQAVILNQWR